MAQTVVVEASVPDEELEVSDPEALGLGVRTASIDVGAVRLYVIGYDSSIEVAMARLIRAATTLLVRAQSRRENAAHAERLLEQAAAASRGTVS